MPVLDKFAQIRFAVAPSVANRVPFIANKVPSRAQLFRLARGGA